MSHECIQSENIGRFKEFMREMNGFKMTLFTIALAIIIQVGAFIYLWGSLTTTVNKNTDHIWNKITPNTEINTRNIDKILSRLDNARIVYAGEKGDKGDKGIQGIQGKTEKDYDDK